MMIMAFRESRTNRRTDRVGEGQIISRDVLYPVHVPREDGIGQQKDRTRYQYSIHGEDIIRVAIYHKLCAKVRTYKSERGLK